MKRIGAVFLTIVLCSTGLYAQKKRVAVMDFDFSTIQKWWESNWDVGKGIGDLIVDELVNNGTFSVIERKQLDTILAEQDFSNSNRANPGSAAEIGKLLGVDAIIIGSVTQFGVEKKGFGLGAIAGKLRRFGGGGIGTKKGKAEVKLTARIVDINTAEILASERGNGKSERSGLLLGGIGVSGGGFGAGGISMTSSDYRETVLGEATEAAVSELSDKLIRKADRVPARVILVRGLVADVDGSTLTLNVGSSAGVKVGDTLKILRVTRTVKDPATGKVLREVAQDQGQVRIDDVAAGFSVGTVTTGSDIQIGDLVRN